MQLANITKAIKNGYVISINEAQMLMHYRKLHIRQLCRDGKLDAIKVDRQWLIKADSIDKYLQSGSRKSTAMLKQQLSNLQAKLDSAEQEIATLKRKTK